MLCEEGGIQDPPTVRKLMISLLQGLDSSWQRAPAAVSQLSQESTSWSPQPGAYSQS